MTSPDFSLRHGSSAAPFRHRLVLTLLQRRRRLDNKSRGFTLVELMIVVAIVGILSAVALPSYLQSRSAAIIGSRVGEAVGFAKECSTLTVSGVGGTITIPVNADAANQGSVALTTGCTGLNSGGVITASWPTGVRAAGVRCLGAAASTATSSQAAVTIGTDGALSCGFS